jgi:hypothetical protein
VAGVVRVTKARVVQCPGCALPLDVSGPPGVEFEIARGHEPAGARVVEIRIGRVSVHRCVLCRDGCWR